MLSKESATEVSDIQDNNILAAKIMVKILKSSLNVQRHDVKEVKSLNFIMIKVRMSSKMIRGIILTVLSNNLMV